MNSCVLVCSQDCRIFRTSALSKNGVPEPWVSCFQRNVQKVARLKVSNLPGVQRQFGRNIVRTNPSDLTLATEAYFWCIGSIFSEWFFGRLSGSGFKLLARTRSCSLLLCVLTGSKDKLDVRLTPFITVNSSCSRFGAHADKNFQYFEVNAHQITIVIDQVHRARIIFTVDHLSAGGRLSFR